MAAHAAIPRALALSATALGAEVEAAWIPTPELDRKAAERLDRCDAIWCVPGSPYASMTGALEGIRWAREEARPFLGTCGGFQHALIEHARNVLGRREADHAESNPSAALPLISPLSCPLVGTGAAVRLASGSLIAASYGRTTAVEEYNCRFGLNPDFRALMEAASLSVGGVDDLGEVRAIELDDHPFFIATLFQPERSALAGKIHPLITAFLRAALESTAASS